MNEKISVIVPCYNVENVIGRCVQSLLSQITPPEFNIYLIDDGSTDRTWEMIQNYQKQYPDLIVAQHKENGGQSSARNVGLDMAHWKYISFVDSDDYVEPDFLYTLFHCAESNHADIAMCAVNRVYGDNGEGKKFVATKNKETTNVEQVMFHSSFGPWNKLYRTALWADIRFPEGMTYEDLATIPRVMCKAGKIASVDKCLYHYWVNPKGTIMSKHGEANRDMLKAMSILECSSLQQSPSILENIYLRYIILSFVRILLTYEKDVSLAYQIRKDAIQKYPSIADNPAIRDANLVTKLYRLFLHLYFNNHIKTSRLLLRLYAKSRETAKQCLKWIKR